MSISEGSVLDRLVKFSAEVVSERLADFIVSFLIENELSNWTVERDVVSGECFLCGYVSSKTEGQKDFSEICSKFTEIGSAKIENVDPLNWVDEYRKSARLWQCENLYWVPTCLKNDVDLPADSIVVSVDPGMAFGSGAHETTQLCARALVMFRGLYEKTGDLMLKTCIDAGCGSGILGISALKMGLSHAIFIDSDEVAIRISRENAIANGLFGDQMTFVTNEIKIGLLGRQADLILANIQSDVLIANASLLVNSVKPGGLLCLSGILESEALEIAEIFKKAAGDTWDSVLENTMKDDEWALIACFRG